MVHKFNWKVGNVKSATEDNGIEMRNKLSCRRNEGIYEEMFDILSL